MVGDGRAAARVPRSAACATMLAAALLGAGAAAAQPVAGRSVLPIREVVVRPIGTPRYVVVVRINGAPVEAGLDTGSVGLRLLPRAVRSTGVAAGPEPDSFGYGSGVRLEGRRAMADVAIGDARGRIPLQAVERVACMDGRECPAARVAPEAYGLMGGGFPGQGFPAILGVRLASRPTPNPLVALGVHRWIVHLPQRGGGGGALVLNPEARETAGFKPLRPGQGAPGTVGGCVGLDFPQARRLCGPTLLDTGATEIAVRGAAPPADWGPGRPARLDLVGEGGGAGAAAVFRTGDSEHGARARFTGAAEVGARPDIAAGVLPFYAFDVLFDADSRTIAVRPNPTATTAVHRAP